MKNIFTFAALFFTIAIQGKAQSAKALQVNAVSLEIGKTGLLYNLTFDHRFSKKKLGIRLGAGSNFGKYLNASSFGGGGYHIVGGKNQFLEMGIDLHYLIVDEISNDQRGFSFVYPDYSIKTLYTSLNVGYRSYGNHTLFRVGVSPGLVKSELVAGGYISFGLTF